MQDEQKAKIVGIIRSVKLAGFVDENTKYGDVKVLDLVRKAIQHKNWSIL